MSAEMSCQRYNGLQEDELYRELLQDTVCIALAPLQTFVRQLANSDCEVDPAAEILLALFAQANQQIETAFSYTREYLGRIEVVTAMHNNSQRVVPRQILAVELNRRQ